MNQFLLEGLSLQHVCPKNSCQGWFLCVCIFPPINFCHNYPIFYLYGFGRCRRYWIHIEAKEDVKKATKSREISQAIG